MMISRYKDRHSAAAYDPMSEVNINNFLNNLFEKILDFERWIIQLGLSFPIGGSLLLVARKVSE